MTTALYRRYRPEAFGEMIGQAQVTEPLMTALRGDRVGHAYLFSGPRGCGKTTSARILARCLNCAQGPTDTPCGECDSCVELGRGGGGSLDVVEIDAASHNGVDDARDLRERAVFAPARDRFKIFILDEAHMVTPQGFNALLKLVEEPPDHVKFIFATTEPEKVIGTIRSRTHHYPFRLVPPAAMLEYVQELCASEKVTVEAGVLPLVVRAGGGSPRDTLSLLDQLIAGSEMTDAGVIVGYERAVSLLGYTHAELLDEVVDAFASADPAAAFSAVDRVVQTGQDPRRFVDDLLERLRDLIVVAATGQGASAVLRGVSAEDLATMQRQADAFGATRLSRTADIVIAALDEMSGATSPRLQLELMIARVLAHAPAAQGGAAPAAAPAPAAAAAAPAPAAAPPVSTPSAPASAAPASTPPAVSTPAAGPAPQAPVSAAPSPQVSAAPASPEPPAVAVPDAPAPAPAPSGPVTVQRMRDAWPEVLARLEDISRTSWLIATGARVADFDADVLTLSFQSQKDVATFKQRSAGSGPSEDLRTAILAVLGIRVKYLAKHEGEGSSDGGGDPGGSGGPGGPPDSPQAPVPPGDGRGASSPPGETVTAGTSAPARSSASTRPSTRAQQTAPASTEPVTDWAVAPIPGGNGVAQFAVDDEPEDAAPTARAQVATLAPARDGVVLAPTDVENSHVADPQDDEDEPAPEVPADDVPVPPVVAPRLPQTTTRDDGVQRYGEAVVRQVLGARFVREEPYEAPTRFN
ncbi:DNA polymerase III subunit gamma and tau [Microbacterium sp. ARD31]|uniref:DNA polymerase III subunit gamma and tau n=1 Tax=Microbacterium sp. ARD31 TaxID=2962576 RepID=UPI0028827CFC|nr:DNA polymerase III subunit gamma and tau [Microbacterium sp. ARD31]MDT0180327.1 DNA polymerase III subunit gamma and tau [Microbacterium sp. ARD31]